VKRKRSKNPPMRAEYEVALTFERWAKSGILEHRPHLTYRRKRVSTYHFRCITSVISLQIGEDGQIIMSATYRGEYFDILREWDVLPIKTKGGYRCGLCKIKKAFASKELLLIEHSLKPMAAWMRKSFQSDKLLLLIRMEESTAAKISSRTVSGAVSLSVVLA